MELERDDADTRYNLLNKIRYIAEEAVDSNDPLQQLDDALEIKDAQQANDY